MKKLFTVMLIAILAMSTVFATTNSKTTGVSGSAETTIKLTVAEDDVNLHNIGFSSESSTGLSAGAVPTQLTSIDLTYVRDQTTESTENNFVYYYYEASVKPILTLTAGEGLHHDGSTKKIEYTLSVAEGNATSGSANNTSTSGVDPTAITLKTTDLNANGVSSGYIAFSVTVNSSITADMVSEAWADTIVLAIQGA